MVVAFIVARFFDTDMSYLYRGLTFIVLGSGFLAANVIMVRAFRRSGEAQ